MLTLGIDSGSTTTKGALFDGEKVVRTAILPTSANPKESIGRLYQMLYNQDVAYTVSTGYGRELLDQADKQITEITCHARGAAFLNPNVRAVVDIGGNDKCAAGTGRFIEVMMRILEEDINNIDQFVQGHQPINITSMCTVFAESEIVSLLAKGADKGDIALGIINSICRRTSFFAQKLNLTGEIFFSGGLARFEIFRSTLESYLKIPVSTSPLSQYAGAIGAAVIGFNKAKRMQA